MTVTSAVVNEQDYAWMMLALGAAAKARPSPNPPVGAVVVSSTGEVVGVGHHAQAGTQHAEELALIAAGEKAKGGTLFVTLEPCNHHGATPPCTEAIIASGVRRVVIACIDPNPHVEGGGAARLKAAGLQVDVGVGEREAKALILPWTKFITHGMPYVVLKLALSLDGRIATRIGASKWVTGAEARLKVQELRSQHDGVAVGIGTALADDPRLTVRDLALHPEVKAPVRIVFDSHLRLPLTSRLVQETKEAQTWIVTGESPPEENERALIDAGCTVLRVPTGAEGRVDIVRGLEALAAQGVVSLLVEGGAELAGSLLAARAADELHAFLAPCLLGPRGRPGAVDWAGPDQPSDAPRIVDPRWELCGHDAYVRGGLAFPAKTKTVP